jgi:hypothetical protein
MSEQPTKLAIGESVDLSDGGDLLRVETTRSDEHLFTTPYRDPDPAPSVSLSR